jgi:hypothetical protein
LDEWGVDRLFGLGWGAAMPARPTFTPTPSPAPVSTASPAPSNSPTPKPTPTNFPTPARLFGGTAQDCFCDATETGDGGYVAVGYTKSNDGDLAGLSGNSSKNALIVRYNNDGGIEWSKSFGASNSSFDECFFSVAKIGGSYVAVGTIMGPSGSLNGDLAGERLIGGFDGLIARFDEDQGTCVYKKVLGGSQSDRFRSVIATADGGYAFAGEVNRTNDFASGTGRQLGALSSGSDDWEAFLRKHNSSDEMEWQTYIGGNGKLDAFSVARINGGYLLSTNVNSRSSSLFGQSLQPDNSEAMLIKLDDNGDAQNINNNVSKIGGAGIDTAESIIEASDSYVMVGRTSSAVIGDTAGTATAASLGGTDGYVARFDKSDLRLLTIQRIGGSGNDSIPITNIWDQLETFNCEYSVIRLDDSDGYGVVGCTSSADFGVSLGNTDVFVATYKSDVLKSAFRYGGSQNDFVYGSLFTGSAIVVAGESNSSNSGAFAGIANHGSYDAYLFEIYDVNMRVFGD